MGAPVKSDDGAKQQWAEALARGTADDTSDATPEDDRARRFLDLWERNLSYLALNGPVTGGARRGR